MAYIKTRMKKRWQQNIFIFQTLANWKYIEQTFDSCGTFFWSCYKDNIKLSLCIHEGICQCGGTAPRIFNPSTRSEQVTSFTLQPLLTAGEELPISLSRRLGQPQNQSQNFGEEENLLLVPATEPQYLT
jgi:hypothetical protein